MKGGRTPECRIGRTAVTRKLLDDGSFAEAKVLQLFQKLGDTDVVPHTARMRTVTEGNESEA
jgi:hypothetical protein